MFEGYYHDETLAKVQKREGPTNAQKMEDALGNKVNTDQVSQKSMFGGISSADTRSKQMSQSQMDHSQAQMQQMY